MSSDNRIEEIIQRITGQGSGLWIPERIQRERRNRVRRLSVARTASFRFPLIFAAHARHDGCRLETILLIARARAVYGPSPVHEIPAHERLAEAVPIADLVTVARKRASGKPAGKNVGTQTGPLA